MGNAIPITQNKKLRRDPYRSCAQVNAKDQRNAVATRPGARGADGSFEVCAFRTIVLKNM